MKPWIKLWVHRPPFRKSMVATLKITVLACQEHSHPISFCLYLTSLAKIGVVSMFGILDSAPVKNLVKFGCFEVVFSRRF